MCAVVANLVLAVYNGRRGASADRTARGLGGPLWGAVRHAHAPVWAALVFDDTAMGKVLKHVRPPRPRSPGAASQKCKHGA